MTYEQIFEGQIALAMAIKHLRNRALCYRQEQPPGMWRGVQNAGSGPAFMPYEEGEAIAMLVSCHEQLEQEFLRKRKHSRKRKKVRP